MHNSRTNLVTHQGCTAGEFPGKDAEIIRSFSSSSGIIIITDCQYIYPLRGFLVQLIPVGCGVPPSSSQAELTHHNSTHTEYRCRGQGEVFTSSLLPTTVLLCVGNKLSTPLPPCLR